MKIGLIFTERPSDGWVPKGVKNPGSGYLIVKPYARPSTKVGLFGWNTASNLTHLRGDGARKPTFGLFKVERQGQIFPQMRQAKIRFAGWAERTHAKAIRMSGNQFEVKDRDGHPVGAFSTVEEAEARAAEVDGFVTDRIEGRVLDLDHGKRDRDGGGVWGWFGSGKQTEEVSDRPSSGGRRSSSGWTWTPGQEPYPGEVEA